jgi:hypothetical protein
MSSNKKKQQQQNKKQEEVYPEVPRCDFCQQPGLSLKACAGCGCEKYCDATCQKARWPHHKVACKAKRLELENEVKGKEAAKERGSGGGLRDMGSIMAVLMNTPQPPSQRYTPVRLFNASLDNHYEELQKMLQQPALDVDWAAPDTGSTAAYAAVQKGNDKCLSMLISHGANMSKFNNEGWAAIHAACEHGRYACLEILANAGAELNLPTTDRQGDTPVILCCQYGHVNCLALLSARGADTSIIDNYGNAPAHIASTFGHLKCLQLLAKRGVDLSKKDSSGLTPLDIARACKHLECIDLLLASGAIGTKEYLPPVRADQTVRIAACQSFFCLRLLFILSFSHLIHSRALLSGNGRQYHKRCEGFPEGCQTMLLASMPGECRGSEGR